MLAEQGPLYCSRVVESCSYSSSSVWCMVHGFRYPPPCCCWLHVVFTCIDKLWNISIWHLVSWGRGNWALHSVPDYYLMPLCICLEFWRQFCMITIHASHQTSGQHCGTFCKLRFADICISPLVQWIDLMHPLNIGIGIEVFVVWTPYLQLVGVTTYVWVCYKLIGTG